MIEALREPVVLALAQIVVAIVTAAAAIATLFAASATRRQARVNERMLRQTMRPLIRAVWTVAFRTGNVIQLRVDIRETTGIPTALKSARVRCEYWHDHPTEEYELNLGTPLLYGEHHAGGGYIPIDITQVTRYPQLNPPHCQIYLDVAVSTANEDGEDVERNWKFCCYVFPSGEDEFDLIPTPVDASVLHETKPNLFQRVVKRLREWEAWNERFRQPPA